MDVFKKLRFSMLVLCIYIALTDPNFETAEEYHPPSSDFVGKFSTSRGLHSAVSSRLMSSEWNNYEDFGNRPVVQESLEYDFYRDSCPKAEKIVKDVVRRAQEVRPGLIPGLVRLVFHDCFIEGCDASILLDGTDEMASEKDIPPNLTLKGFEVIDIIKEEVESVCPDTVSCADILVLAAREALLQAGGPYYPVSTGRRDSVSSYAERAAYQLPSPYGDLEDMLSAFAARGFDERETVNLFGAHSIGIVHCKSFHMRLYNFSGTNEPDPTLDPDLLDTLRLRCNNDSGHLPTPPCASPSSNPPPSTSPSPGSFEPPPFLSPSPSGEPTRTVMFREGSGTDFGTAYFRGLLQGKGILYADQQLMSREETRDWVRAYAWDAALFRKDFSETMMKLSNLMVLTYPHGQIRRICSKVA